MNAKSSIHIKLSLELRCIYDFSYKNNVCSILFHHLECTHQGFLRRLDVVCLQTMQYMYMFTGLGTSVALPFCNFHRLGVPEQALGGIPLGFGIVMEKKL